MVAHFKVRTGRTPVYEITRENVEGLLERRAPWFRQGQERGDDHHFAVCPYRLKARTHGKNARRDISQISEQLIDTAIREFDRIVLILRDDFGFAFSDAFASRMLDQWFDSEGYLYTGAHLRNLPWMIGYFGPAQSLFGQHVGRNADLVNGILTNVPQALITENGKLGKGSAWYRLDLQCLHHKVDVEQEAGALTESLALRVQDFTSTNEAAQAPTIYKKDIIFDLERFEALVHTPPERARRNANLLKIAQDVATKRGQQCRTV